MNDKTSAGGRGLWRGAHVAWRAGGARGGLFGGLFGGLLVLGLSAGAWAQPGGAFGPPGGGPPPGPGMAAHPGGKAARAMRKRIRAKLTALRGEVLRKDVGLDDARARKIEALLSEHESQRKTLEKQLRRHSRAMHLLVRSDSDDQQAYKRAVDGVLAARKALAEHRSREFRALRKTLSPKEQARLLMGLQRLKRRAHRVIEKARRAHMERQARELLNK